MEILRWDKRFCVADKNINQQHKMLFELINKLLTKSRISHRRHKTEEVLEELVKYSQYHFTTEEEVLAKHPSIENHRQSHAEFIKKIHFFKEVFKDGKEEINGELFTFLVEWIGDHILETDVVVFEKVTPDSVSPQQRGTAAELVLSGHSKLQRLGLTEFSRQKK